MMSDDQVYVISTQELFAGLWRKRLFFAVPFVLFLVLGGLMVAGRPDVVDVRTVVEIGAAPRLPIGCLINDFDDQYCQLDKMSPDKTPTVVPASQAGVWVMTLILPEIEQEHGRKLPEIRVKLKGGQANRRGQALRIISRVGKRDAGEFIEIHSKLAERLLARLNREMAVDRASLSRALREISSALNILPAQQGLPRRMLEDRLQRLEAVKDMTRESHVLAGPAVYPASAFRLHLGLVVLAGAFFCGALCILVALIVGRYRYGPTENGLSV